MRNQVRLLVPFEVTGDDVKKALSEQSKDESAVARVLERLHGVAAERAAIELNRALEVGIFDALAHGWAQVPAVSRAVQLSVLTRRPPRPVNVDRHRIASTALVVLETSFTESTLPPLELSLEIRADVQSAILTACDGRIDVVALGEASVRARLKYKGMLVKEHATGITCVTRDPFKPRPSAPERPNSVDIPI